MMLFEQVSLLQYAYIALAAFVISVIGGVSGYGGGLLMPVILAPIIGAEAVVPILSIAALFNNASRIVAFRTFLDKRRALIVGLAALPTCVMSAWFYTRLSGPLVSIFLGVVLVTLVPVRHLLARLRARISDPMLGASGFGYGAIVGGTTGSGVVLIALLLAAGLEARAVMATDAAITFIVGIAKTLTFQSAGALPASSWIMALVIGIAAIPGAFIAKRLTDGLKPKSHAAILDGVVVLGGLLLVWQGLAG